MRFVEKSIELQNKVEDNLKHIGTRKYGRVIKLSRKPTGEEYKKVLQITGAGMLIIGGGGFLIYLMWNNFYSWLLWLLG